MADIFKEVDEALKQEKLEKFWSEYKNTIITAIIILIGSTAVTSAYQAWDTGRDQTETAALLKALNAPDPQETLNSFASDTRRGHKIIAQMTKASLLLKSGKEEDKIAAAEIYTSIAKKRSAPKDFRDLARILAVRHSNQNDESMALLKPLLKDNKNPFHWHASLEAATFYAHSKNDYTKAIEYLTPFTQSELIPASLKQTAESLLHIYKQKSKN